MARLPIIGRDDGAWGDILNDFLLVEHNTDGTLKRASDIDDLLTAAPNKYEKPVGGIPFTDLSTTVQNILVKADNAVVVVPATINSKGAIRLTGDLGGTADSPTTPTAVHLDGAETITGAKTFVIAPVVPDSSFAQSAIIGLTSDLNAKAPTDSPALTGTPTAPTASTGTNTTQIATTAFVQYELNTHDTTTMAYVDSKVAANTLPVQTGNSGKFLTTNGSALSWGTVPTPQVTTPLALNAYGGTFSPAKSTTYYFGSLWNVSPTTSANFCRVYVPKTGTIKKAYVFCNQGQGSGETSTLSIRLNNTTDTVISSAITNNTGATSFSHTSLNIAVNAGDYFELKWDTPAWATNPTNVRLSVTIYME